MRPIIVDIAEFVANPLRSGIQRVVRELVVRWPADVPVVFARYNAVTGGLVRLSPRDLRGAIDHLPEKATGRPPSSEDPMPRRIGRGNSLPLRADDVVLVPEVFYDPGRVAFYDDVLAKRRCGVGFVVFDFIPWLKPSAIKLGTAGSTVIMPYLMLLLRARNRCFISAAVRDEFVRRIARTDAHEAGPVFPLGADSFKLAKQRFSPDRVDILCIGTLDGKKGQDIVFDAFVASRGGQRGRLVCLGKVPARPAPWMRELLTCSRPDVVVVDSPSEEAICAALEQARASVFVSTSEGFGLPAVESLHCGVPVVAHEGLPCLAGLPSAGQIRLPRVTTATVEAALMRLADDGEARTLWSEAESVKLQTWSGYAECLADWMVEMSKKDLAGERRSLPAAPASGEDLGADERVAS